MGRWPFRLSIVALQCQLQISKSGHCLCETGCCLWASSSTIRTYERREDIGTHSLSQVISQLNYTSRDINQVISGTIMEGNKNMKQKGNDRKISPVSKERHQRRVKGFMVERNCLVGSDDFTCTADGASSDRAHEDRAAMVTKSEGVAIGGAK